MDNVKDLKSKVLEILDKATNGKILTRELLDFTKGGVPVCILICETGASIKAMRTAVYELLQEDRILLNPSNNLDKSQRIKLSNEIKEKLKQSIFEGEGFISSIVSKF